MEDMQWEEPGSEREGQIKGTKTRKKKKKPVLAYTLIALLVLVLLILINVKEMQEEKKEHPPEEIALYLEQCFGFQFNVTYNAFSAFSDSRYAGQIPYVAETVLEDGSTLTFSVGLDRAYPYMEGGLYTDFEEELLEHYASVYGIVCETDIYGSTLYPTREQIEGKEPTLKKYLDTLMAGSYIQSGQVINLDISLENSFGESITLSREISIDYTELSEKLIDLLER